LQNIQYNDPKKLRSESAYMLFCTNTLFRTPFLCTFICVITFQVREWFVSGKEMNDL